MARKNSDVLGRVRAVAQNLWWTWNSDAQRLFAAMDPLLFAATNQSPLKTLRMLAPERREALEQSPAFVAHLERVEGKLAEYLGARTWFERGYGKKMGRRRPVIAYFCAEYAVHESVPQYSGGLGVLAGDHLKSASDLGVPLVGVGLLYRCGFYTQELREDGSTRVIYPRLDFGDLPVRDTGKVITVPIGGRGVRARVWEMVVGRVRVYLMDTDVEGNRPADRALTRHLYGGDREYRIRQEMLLGVGGMMALDAVGVRPTVCHLNEGHAAFNCLERLRRLMREGSSYEEAARRVRGTTVFTTHTPVPAGNDRFEPRLAWKYLAGFGRELGLSKDEVLALGREDEANRAEEFCMTVLALKLAGHCNGVAELHGETSRKMWMKVFGAGASKEVPIGHVTNGVHAQTWLAPEMEPVYERYLKPRWVGAGPGDDWWKRVDRVPDEELWAARQVLRSKLVTFVRNRLVDQVIRRNGSVEEVAAARAVFDEDALTIGFARRFATYKRATLIFRDPKRLAGILNNPARPVQIVFAGKAHPADVGGQAFAQEIHRLSRRHGFAGRVVLLEDYDMQVGRVLTSGADVWLNNPLRPQEASGTSGMKGPLHGGINCSILDGWWPEAFNGKNGWAIGDGREFKSQEKQDRYDAGAIYELLEREIVPEFYEVDRRGLPGRWVKRMKESMRSVCGVFNTHRMVAEYLTEMYLPAHAEAR